MSRRNLLTALCCKASILQYLHEDAQRNRSGRRGACDDGGHVLPTAQRFHTWAA